MEMYLNKYKQDSKLISVVNQRLGGGGGGRVMVDQETITELENIVTFSW
jgi:hypothetical protein